MNHHGPDPLTIWPLAFSAGSGLFALGAAIPGSTVLAAIATIGPFAVPIVAAWIRTRPERSADRLKAENARLRAENARLFDLLTLHVGETRAGGA